MRCTTTKILIECCFARCTSPTSTIGHCVAPTLRALHRCIVPLQLQNAAKVAAVHHYRERYTSPCDTTTTSATNRLLHCTTISLSVAPIPITLSHENKSKLKHRIAPLQRVQDMGVFHHHKEHNRLVHCTTTKSATNDFVPPLQTAPWNFGLQPHKEHNIALWCTPTKRWTN